MMKYFWLYTLIFGLLNGNRNKRFKCIKLWMMSSAKILPFLFFHYKSEYMFRWLTNLYLNIACWFIWFNFYAAPFVANVYFSFLKTYLYLRAKRYEYLLTNACIVFMNQNSWNWLWCECSKLWIDCRRQVVPNVYEVVTQCRFFISEYFLKHSFTRNKP